MEIINRRGGARPNSGRPSNDRKYMLNVRISKEAHDIICEQKNKSEYIDNLIKQNQQEI